MWCAAKLDGQPLDLAAAQAALQEGNTRGTVLDLDFSSHDACCDPAVLLEEAALSRILLELQEHRAVDFWRLDFVSTLTECYYFSCQQVAQV